MSTQSPSACPFCAIPESAWLGQNELAYWVHDIAPSAPGHALVIPKRHVASFFDLYSEERAAILALINEARIVAEQRHAPGGYNIGLNDGAVAGQSVPHVHLHLIPRHAGDVPDPRGGIRWVLPETAPYWNR